VDSFAKPLPRRHFLVVALSVTALAAVPHQAAAVVPAYYGRGYNGGYS